MAYGDPINITLPTVGGTFGTTGATNVNNAINTLKTVLEQKVTPAGISINSDLDFKPVATSYGIADAQRVSFDNLSALLSAGTYPYTSYVKDGNFYFNDGSGNQIALTSAGTIAGAPGNITGSGYGSSGKEVNWVDGSLLYRMRSGSATDDFADVQMDDLLLNDGSANFLRLTAQAMSADYTITFPAAAPASDVLLQMSSAGTISASNTLASGAHITLVGTGRYKHGIQEVAIGLAAGQAESGTIQFNIGFGNWGFLTTADSARLYLPINFVVGQRITSLEFNFDSITAGTTGTITCALIRIPYLGAETVVASAATSGSTDQTVTVASINHTILTDNTYHILFTVSASWDRVFELDTAIAFYDFP